MLSKAIARDDLSLVSWFLSHGASANLAYTAYTSSTPLSIACASASLPIIQLLVSRGADVKVGNHLHALAECSLPGRVEILDYLVDEGAPVNVLLDVHNPKRFEMSSRWGASPPLHYAVKNGNVEVIRGLLRRGAEKGFRDAKGRTALEVAREEGREEMVGLLSS